MIGKKKVIAGLAAVLLLILGGTVAIMNHPTTAPSAATTKPKPKSHAGHHVRP